MLFVWDVHINAKQSQKILQALREFVASFPAEKNIVFLGDYMYMFSYDRQALADLFDFFLLLGARSWGRVCFLCISIFCRNIATGKQTHSQNDTGHHIIFPRRRIHK